MALEAGKWLAAYADNLMRVDSVEPEPAMGTREEVNAELRGWYAKALGPMESLVREAESFEPEAKKACKNFWSWATVIKASAWNVV
jgi:hypothetical protein